MPGLHAIRARRLPIAFGFALVALSLSAPLRAEPQRQAEVESSQRALTLGHEALEAFERGEYTAALERFEDAEDEAHSPVFVLYMARSNAALGHLLRARELFEKVRAEALPDDAPEAWRAAQQSAEEEQISLDARVPSLLLVIDGPTKPPFEVTIGPQSTDIDERTHEFELDPGSYAIAVTDAAGRRREQSVTLAEGEREARVVFTFPKPTLEKSTASKTKARPESASKPPRSSPTEPDTTREKSTENLGAWTVLGVGALATAVGIATGTVAWAKARHVRSRCDGLTCPTELEDDADQARTWANVASVGFAVGIVGLGGGLLLFEGDDDPTARGAASAPCVFVSGRF